MPDDSSLVVFHILLGFLNTEVLVMSTGLLYFCVKDYEVMDDLKKPVFIADEIEVIIEGIVKGVCCGFFLPL